MSCLKSAQEDWFHRKFLTYAVQIVRATKLLEISISKSIPIVFPSCKMKIRKGKKEEDKSTQCSYL